MGTGRGQRRDPWADVLQPGLLQIRDAFQERLSDPVGHFVETPGAAMGLMGYGDPTGRQAVLDSMAMAPVVGDFAGPMADLNRFYFDPSSRTLGNLGLAGIGLLPFAPSMMSSLENIDLLAKGSEEQIKAAKKAGLRKEELAQATVPGYDRKRQYLTDAEIERLNSNQASKSARKLVEVSNAMPAPAEMATVARAAGMKAGWYPESERALRTVFGDDTPRFVALLSAMSPQTSVQSNLKNALNTWKNWVAAGRPNDPQQILEIMGRSVEGDKGVGSVLGAWRKNAFRALSASDDDIRLSGPKVDSFMRNLLGNRNEVTNDAWVANYGLLNQNLFSQAQSDLITDQFGKVGVKSPGYIGANVNTRQAAEMLGVDPSQIQETDWSFAKTLYEQSRANQMLPTDYLKAGLLTDQSIWETPAFNDLLLMPEYSGIVTEAGLGERLGLLEHGKRALSDPYTRIGIEPEQLESTVEGQRLLAASGRLDKLALRRAREKDVTRALEAGNLPELEIARARLRDEMHRSPGYLYTPKERTRYFDFSPAEYEAYKNEQRLKRLKGLPTDED
jgi:hypothetical protein